MRLLSIIRDFALAAVLLTAPARAAEPLPGLGIDRTQVSVSGLSSGAFMAMQVHVAHSATVIGAGIVAGGPYFCAGGNPAYVALCAGSTAVAPNARLLHWGALGLAAAGKIDPLTNLRRARVYLFSGTADDVVNQTAVSAVQEFYNAAQLPDTQLVFIRDVRAGHAFVTPQAGQACAATAPPYLNRCLVDGRPYDMAGAILAHIHGPLAVPAEHPTGRLAVFDQRSFGDAYTGLAETGRVYIPADCRDRAGCRLHIAFHGCLGAGEADAAANADAWYSRTGYNRWADRNRIVVLYPQVRATAIPYNPDACWDWWGYTGPAYATRDGAQVGAVMRMVETMTRPAAARVVTPPRSGRGGGEPPATGR